MTQEERRVFLLDYLIHESVQYKNLSIPQKEQEQKQLLRALLNVRPAGAASGQFLKIQDEYLQYEMQKKGITDCMRLPLAREKISLWQGDITTLRCGAIVNAANSAMLGCFIPGHSCIDNAIHTYAGVQLRMECGAIMQRQGYAEPTAQAKITGAYNLPCHYILHTVGPIITGSPTAKDCQLLASCYRACLQLAEEYHLTSVAFCCIATGEFRFPNEKAAEIAVKTVSDYLQNSRIERVIFNVFKDADKRIYQRVLGQMQPAANCAAGS